MSEIITIIISITALVVSLIHVYIEFIRVKGPNIGILNQDEQQRAILLTYSNLPESVRQQFPDYPERLPYYALIRLIFVNTGDRVGFLRIKDVKVIISTEEGNTEFNNNIKVSYYTHCLVPAMEIMAHDIVELSASRRKAQTDFPSLNSTA
jgi:hypothetical protein